MTDYCADDVVERFAFLTVRTADLHATDACYHTDCYGRFLSRRSLSGHTKKDTPNDNALLSLVKEFQSQLSHRLDSVGLMERYFELAGKRMRRSTLINLIFMNVEDMVVQSALCYQFSPVAVLCNPENDQGRQ